MSEPTDPSQVLPLRQAVQQCIRSIEQLQDSLALHIPFRYMKEATLWQGIDYESSSFNSILREARRQLEEK